LIKERDLNNMDKFISIEYGDLKIEDRYNNRDVIVVNQDKFIFSGDEK
jgi:hypothetical protein